MSKSRIFGLKMQLTGTYATFAVLHTLFVKIGKIFTTKTPRHQDKKVFLIKNLFMSKSDIQTIKIMAEWDWVVKIIYKLF